MRQKRYELWTPPNLFAVTSSEVGGRGCRQTHRMRSETTVRFAQTKKSSLILNVVIGPMMTVQHVTIAMAQEQLLWLSLIEIYIIKCCFIVKLDGDFTLL